MVERSNPVTRDTARDTARDLTPVAVSTAELVRQVAEAKGGDPLARVTVIVPSHIAAIAGARNLARGVPPGGKGTGKDEAPKKRHQHEAERQRGAIAPRGSANVTFATLADAAAMLGTPLVTSRGKRRAGAHVEAEAARSAAIDAGGQVGAMVHDEHSFAALRHALAELGRCSEDELDLIAGLDSMTGSLARLLRQARSLLDDAGYVDGPGIEEAAIEAAANQDPAMAPGDGHLAVGSGGCLSRQLGAVVVSDPGPMSPRQSELLSRLLGDRSLVRDTYPDTYPDTYRRVERASRCRIVEPTLDCVVECSDPEEEVRLALRKVIARCADGIPLWRQAVLHPGGQRYARILRQELAGAGIPGCGPAQRELSRSLTARTLVALLRLIGGDWGRAELIRWLSSAPIVEGAEMTPVPSSAWDMLSARAGIVRGAGQWIAKLERLVATWPARAAAGSADWAARGAAAGSAEGPIQMQARRLLGFVEELAQRASAADGAMRGGTRSWASWAEWSSGLLERYLPLEVLAGYVVPAGQPAHRPVNLRGPGVALSAGYVATRELEAGEEVRRVLSDLAELDRVSQGADFRVFTQALITELASRSEASPGRSYGEGVFVAPFSAARGMHFEAAVAIGLCESQVPGEIGENPLIPDDTCSLVSSGALRSRAARIAEERLAFMHAIAAGGAACSATWPRSEPRTGRENTLSRWAEEASASATRSVAPSFTASVMDTSLAASLFERDLGDLANQAATGSSPRYAALGARCPLLPAAVEAARAGKSNDLTRFDGLVGRHPSLSAPALVVSPTRLEAYATCPRRYLFERVLRILPRDLPEELWQMHPREKGSVVHAILEDYVSERLNGAPASIDRLLAIAEEHLEKAASRGVGGIPLMWRLDRFAMRRDLRRFFREDVLDPVAAELSFGYGDGSDAGATGHDPASGGAASGGAAAPLEVALADGSVIEFRGKADRVDRASDGTLVVSDYKTGRQDDLRKLLRDPVANGTRLQLPLYALAAARRFGAGDRIRARYWLLSTERSSPSYDLPLTEAVLDRFREIVGRILAATTEGVFPAVPGKPRAESFENCSSCPYDSICPPDRDVRWALERQSPGAAPALDVLEAPVPDELAGIVVAGPLVTVTPGSTTHG